jgi:hypothetical protein
MTIDFILGVNPRSDDNKHKIACVRSPSPQGGRETDGPEGEDRDGDGYGDGTVGLRVSTRALCSLDI